MRKLVDLTGQRFGRLTVIERTASTNKNAKWLCRCDDGNYVSVFGMDLKSGKTQSCGCIHSEQLAQRNYKHGLSDNKLCDIWRSMKERCYNPHFEQYNDYGGRGIMVCPEWLHDFQAFYDWAMANGYADNLSIDRINNNGNYEPSNCRWATRQEQANNKRSNHLLTFNGKTQTLSQWSQEVHIKSHTLLARLKRGWSVEKTLTTPVKTQIKQKAKSIP